LDASGGTHSDGHRVSAGRIDGVDGVGAVDAEAVIVAVAAKALVSGWRKPWEFGYVTDTETSPMKLPARFGQEISLAIAWVKMATRAERSAKSGVRSCIVVVVV